MTSATRSGHAQRSPTDSCCVDTVLSRAAAAATPLANHNSGHRSSLLLRDDDDDFNVSVARRRCSTKASNHSSRHVAVVPELDTTARDANFKKVLRELKNCVASTSQLEQPSDDVIDVEVKFKRVLLELRSSVNLRDCSTRSDVMTSSNVAQKHGAAKGMKDPKVTAKPDKSGNAAAGQEYGSRLSTSETETKGNLLKTHIETSSLFLSRSSEVEMANISSSVEKY